jgi:DNA-binding beta-propeller fold protein YncE/DNA-directed RNA polymerase subunit RPC12/RpoP
MIQTFQCPNCQASLAYETDERAVTVRCDYCNSTVIVPETLRTTGQPAELPAQAYQSQTEQLAQVVRLVKDGRKVEAANLFRQTFHVSLAEANQVVTAIERNESLELGLITATSLSSLEHSGGQVIDVREGPLGWAVGCLILTIIVAVVGIIVLPLVFAGGLPPGEMIDRLLGRSERQLEIVVDLTSGEGSEALAAQIEATAMATTVVTLTPVPTATPAFAEPAMAVGEPGTGRGQFENPRRLAVDNNGRIYVWDMDGRRVQVFDEAGAYQTQWPLDQTVRFLLADRQGHLYVLGDELTIHEGATGELVGRIVVETPAGTIGSFTAMAFTPQGDLVLSYWDNEAWTNYLLVADREGTLLESWPGVVTNHYGQDGMAKQLVVDRQGRIYAFELEAILKFGPDGLFLNRVGGRGSGPGEWSAPQNIAVDGNGRLYIGEWRGIHVYDGNARFLDTIPTDAYVMDLALSDNNDIWAIVGEQVVRFTIQR